MRPNTPSAVFAGLIILVTAWSSLAAAQLPVAPSQNGLIPPSVKDLGAEVNRLLAQSSNVEVRLGQGKYASATPIVVPSGHTLILVGSPSGGTVVLYSGAGSFLLVDGTVKEKAGISVTDLQVGGSGSNDGISVKWAQRNLRLQNVVLSQFSTALRISATWLGSITDLRAYNCGIGILLTDADGDAVNAISVNNPIIENCRTGMVLEGEVLHNTVHGGTFEGNTVQEILLQSRGLKAPVNNIFDSTYLETANSSGAAVRVVGQNSTVRPVGNHFHSPILWGPYSVGFLLDGAADMVISDAQIAPSVAVPVRTGVLSARVRVEGLNDAANAPNLTLGQGHLLTRLSSTGSLSFASPQNLDLNLLSGYDGTQLVSNSPSLSLQGSVKTPSGNTTAVKAVRRLIVENMTKSFESLVVGGTEVLRAASNGTLQVTRSVTSPVFQFQDSGVSGPCTFQERRQMKWVDGTVTSPDQLMTCMKTATNTYRWVAIASG